MTFTCECVCVDSAVRGTFADVVGQSVCFYRSYELRYPLGDPDWIPISVYHRELRSVFVAIKFLPGRMCFKYDLLALSAFLRQAQAYGNSSRSTYRSVFGLPLVVSVPRKGCSYQTLRCCILNHCTRYVKISQGHPWNKELQNRELA